MEKRYKRNQKVLFMYEGLLTEAIVLRAYKNTVELANNKHSLPWIATSQDRLWAMDISNPVQGH